MEKYNSEEELKEFGKQMYFILDKYDYDDKFKYILKKIAFSMLEYYGTERKNEILNAFNNNYVYVGKTGENASDVIENHFSVPMRFREMAGHISAMYLWVAVPKDGKINVESLIYIPNQLGFFDLDSGDCLSDYCLQTLIHELNHCVKTNGYYKLVGDNKIEIASGVNHTVYDISSIPYKIIDDKYDAIEEVMNVIQEYDIFSALTGRDPVESGIYTNSTCRFTAFLDQLPELGNVIVESEFDKSNKWIKYIGVDRVERLDAILKKEHENPGEVLKEGTIENDEFEQLTLPLVAKRSNNL